MFNQSWPSSKSTECRLMVIHLSNFAFPFCEIRFHSVEWYLDFYQLNGNHFTHTRYSVEWTNNYILPSNTTYVWTTVGLLLYVFIWKCRLVCRLCFIWVPVIEPFRSFITKYIAYINVIASLSDLHVLSHDLHLCWNVCIKQRKWFVLLSTRSGRP